MKCSICDKSLSGKKTKFCSAECKNKSTGSYEAQQRRGIGRKLKYVEDGCIRCGYRKNLSCLVFHHRDPKDKSFEITSRKLSNCSIDELELEISKCDILCHNCHNELHYPDLEIIHTESGIECNGHPVFQEKIKRPKKLCVSCGKEIQNISKKCLKCFNLNREIIDWPEDQDLIELVQSTNYSYASRKIGCSPNAVKRRYLKIYSTN